MNQLRQMSVFARIVEAGSISAAADAMELSKSVVSQHLKALEEGLGVTLLKRTTRRQTLTEVGRSFYKQCKQLNDIAEDAWTQAQNALSLPKGRVRITAPHALMDALIVPAIAAVLKDYPALQPELISNDQQLNLDAEDIDLAIRVGPSPDSSMKQKRIGHFHDVICGLPELISQGINHDTPYIANQWQSSNIEHHLTHKTTGSLIALKVRPQCRTNSFHTCFSLIEEGVGIGIVPEFLLKGAGSALREAYPEYQLPENAVYGVFPFAGQMPINVKICLDAIEAHLRFS